MFEKYPPDEKIPFPHYKSGFRTWGSSKITSRISICVSLLAIVVSIIASFIK